MDIALSAERAVVRITATQLPPFEIMESRFTKGGICRDDLGKNWKRHASAIGQDKSPGERIIWFARPPMELMGEVEEIIAWGDVRRSISAPLGHRPITHVELYDVSKELPEDVSRSFVVALGSYMLNEYEHRNVAAYYHLGGPVFYCYRDTKRWPIGTCFPFTPKMS